MYVPSYKHYHEDSFVGGRISVVSPVEENRGWRDPAERQLATAPKAGTEEAGGGGGSGQLFYGELQFYSPKALLWLKWDKSRSCRQFPHSWSQAIAWGNLKWRTEYFLNPTSFYDDVFSSLGGSYQ